MSIRQKHVFVSYVREDEAEVEQLSTALTKEGVNVWLDKDQIKPGARWKQSIRDAIADGNFFLACFSRNYYRREVTYMNEELLLAIEILRQHHYDRAWFIPVMLTECKVPKYDIGGGETLRDLQWVPLYRHRDEGVKRIISVIQPLPRAAQDLISALDSDFAAAREGAAVALGQLKDARLSSILMDKSRCIRNDLHGYLVHTSGEANDIIELCKVSQKIKYHLSFYNCVVNSLAVIGERKAVPMLLDELNLGKHSFARCVAETRERFLPILANPMTNRILEEIEISLRVCIIAALGQIGDRRVVPALLKELRHEDYRICCPAANALGRMGDRRAVPPLIDTLKRHAFERLDAIYALAKFDDIRATSALVTALRDDSELFSHINMAIRNVGERAVPILIQALDGSTPSERQRLTSMLADVATDEARQTLIGLLDDGNMLVRHGAVMGLGRIGDPAVIPFLKNALNDEESLVRRVATDALRTIGTSDAIPLLIQALHDEDECVRMDASAALGEIGSAEAIPDLIATLDDNHPTVRAMAAYALGLIGNPTSVPYLAKLLGDKDTLCIDTTVAGERVCIGVRSAAVMALRKIGTAEALDALASLDSGRFGRGQPLL